MERGSRRPEVIAAHRRQNDNAWQLGLVAVKDERMRGQEVMSLVGREVSRRHE
jgi:hypothetical protein